MRFTLTGKAKKRVDLLIEPVRSGDWLQQLKWKYYDDFKLNPINYSQLT
jgi:hypothetical protein